MLSQPQKTQPLLESHCSFVVIQESPIKRKNTRATATFITNNFYALLAISQQILEMMSLNCRTLPE